MHKTRVLWMALLLATTGSLVSCTNDSLDDGSGPDVVLEVTTLENQPVTATEDETTDGELARRHARERQRKLFEETQLRLWKQLDKQQQEDFRRRLAEARRRSRRAAMCPS